MSRLESMDRFIVEFTDHSLSRRDLLKRSAVLGVSVPVVASLIAACEMDNGDDDVIDEPAVDPDEDDEPVEEPDDDDEPDIPDDPSAAGDIVIATASEPFRLDPAIAGSGDEYQLTQAIYNNLIRVNTDLEPVPELAESYDVSDDGLVYTLELHEGIEYHHGKEFAAEDAVFTVERILDEDTASPGRSVFAVIDSMETPDDHTLIFNLSEPFADFPMILGTTFGRILPSDRSEEEISSDPVGTGPFILDLWEPGSQVILVRNDNYWEEGLPRADRIIQVQIPEQTGQAAAISEGQIDLMWDVSPHVISTLEASGQVTIEEIPSPSFQPIGMRSNVEPFDDPRVRLALKYCVDRSAIVEAVTEGHGTEANDHPVPPISPFWHDTGLKERDIGRAMELLEEAGYGDGIDVILHTSDERTGLVDHSTIVQEMAAEAGFRIELQVHPWDIFVAEYNDTALLFCTNWFGRPTIDETVYQYYHSEGSWNEYDYSNSEIDGLLEAGRSELDEDRRMEIYSEIQEILSEDGPVLIPYHRTYISAKRNSIRDYEPHPIRWVDLRWAYKEEE